MRTTSTRIAALAGAVALTFGAAACGKTDTPSTPAAAASSAGSAMPTMTSDPGATPSETMSSSSDAGDMGGDSSEAAQILEKAKDNALKATSAAFSGEIEQNGETMKIDYKGTSDGKTADVSIETDKQGKARVISVDDAVYIQADATFWKRQGAPASVQKAGDKFIKAPSSAASMVKSLSLKTFADKAFGSVNSSQLASDVAEESVDGIDCWVLTDRSGKENGALYVSKDANEVVRFTGTKKTPGELNFSKWNEDLGIKAPPASQVMSLGG
ncbi:hypothetical protein [Terracoccus luteus]|jgi:hypothetical protein|uniref:Lipoprotein n=1 Tax=Terracoccus luteus TaxID=53356 RepID=A0A495XZW8_9MICO|nr:hypothetical protein [Terracoccus luteus]MBB2985671.1 hypothetical protein [Terracoccus luteus]MCP2171323.1 hypothetical protein [Terracoccus luteus]RKT78424.1 hypothetical protein DFJ68_1869 [Terracoccus luteus]